MRVFIDGERKSISLTGQRSREEARYAYADAMLKAREA